MIAVLKMRIKSKDAKTKPKVKSKVTYNCPFCDKTYASIQGFRGHMSKKHDRPDIKGKPSLFIYIFIYIF